MIHTNKETFQDFLVAQDLLENVEEMRSDMLI